MWWHSAFKRTYMLIVKAGKMTGLQNSVSDLPAEEALHHHTCKEDKRKRLPRCTRGYIFHRKGIVDRPKSSSKVTALHYAFEYIEHKDDENVTLQELHQRMIRGSGLNKDDVYTQVQLKRELVKHYGSRVPITTVKQLQNIIL